MKKYCVYKHTCPNGKVYIGITCQEPKYRWGKDGNKYENNEHFSRAIKKYGWNNISHDILFDGLSKDEACRLECELISKYQCNDPKFGYNMTNGGDGVDGYKFSDEQLAIRRERFKGENNPMYGKCGELNPMYGKKHTEEAKKKMSDAARKRVGELSSFYGKHHKEESKYWKGKHLPKEVRDKISKSHDKDKKPVKQIDVKTGNVIQIFPSIMDAARALNINESSIIRTCKGKQHTSLGFKWEYVDKD